MSNHSGSYMLNDVIAVLKKEKVFENRTKEDIYSLVMKLSEIGKENDCNMGEILEGHRDLGICYYCEQLKDAVDSNCLCEECDGDIEDIEIYLERKRELNT